MYHIPIQDTQANKPTTLHLSQVVNRVSRCNYVLRRYVRQAQESSPKTTLSVPPHESNIILRTKYSLSFVLQKDDVVCL